MEYFGSFATLIFLPTSDIDVVVTTKFAHSRHHRHSPGSVDAPPPMRELAEMFKTLNICRDDVQILDKAAVPIIKITDLVTDIKVDISFNQPYGVATANFVNVSLRDRS